MSERFSRQSFLGENAEEVIGDVTVGIVGLGGGGSHIVQQLAHVGFSNFVLYDGDVIEDSNLNRLVGGTVMDVAMATPKVLIAERVVRGLVPAARVERRACTWQQAPEPLRSCDIIFGCVDGYQQRWELQTFAHRFCIPYIDIGLDVFGQINPQMRGQVILTVPGGPCMKCVHFVDDENLNREAQRYGDAGIRPQVVWANGVLASTAVGLAVDLLTNWSKRAPPKGVVYLSYDGNTGAIGPDKRLQFVGAGACPHFTAEDVGEPMWAAI